MNYDIKIVEDYIKSINYYNFQDFCDRLLIKLYPDDYTPVRAGGRLGDMKNDGYCAKSRIFFQAHATRGEQASVTKKKIQKDLKGCIKHWKDVRRFVYITNDTLLGTVEHFVDELRPKYKSLQIETWGHSKLVEKIRALSLNDVEYIIDRKIVFEESYSESELLTTKFLITNNFPFIKEIADRNFENFPFENPLLLENNVFHFMSAMVKNKYYRHNEIERSVGEITPAEYSTSHPDAIELNPDKDEYQFKYHERVPKAEELLKATKNDPISSFLINGDVPIDKVTQLYTCYSGECGGDGSFQEVYLLRPLYAKFLIVKNISEKPIRLNKLIGHSANGVLFDEAHFANAFEFDLPEILIEPSQNVIIPTGLFLSDFKGLDTHDRTEVSQVLLADSYQMLSKPEIKAIEKIEFIGPQIIPSTLNITFRDRPLEISIHKFSFDKTYYVDRNWACGSCPHLFYRFGEDLKYQGEIFNELPNQTKKETFVIPHGVSEVIIAELEQETTYINFIKINDREVSNDIVLREDQFHSIAVSANDKISLQGKYVLDGEMMHVLPISEKEKLVEGFKTKNSILIQ